MESIDREIMWRQFGASIDMFGSTVQACPDELWAGRLWGDQEQQWVAIGFSQFWYLAFHTLFWLDLYLTGDEEEKFAPPQPFDLTEMEPGGVLPRIYSRDEILGYLDFCRRKCHDLIMGLSQEELYRPCRYPWGEVPWVELQLYNLRHVQEHGAQLRMFLGQQQGIDARWFSKARE